MSDFRNSNYDYRNPDDPFRADANLDPNVRTPSQAWGWIAAAVFLVVVVAIGFGYGGHRPGQLGTNTASNDGNPPAVTRMAPPATVPPPGTPTPPAATSTPPAGAPNAPGAPGVTH